MSEASSAGSASSSAATSSTPASSGSGSGGGALCGAGKWDSYWGNGCGTKLDDTVACRDVEAGCSQVGRVCGCDGVVHDNECAAQAAGADLDDRGGCTPPSGVFPCGARFCSTGSYCVHTGDLDGFPDQFTCLPLPSACGGTATCDCVARAQCGEDAFTGETGTCITVPNGGVINRCDSARVY